MLREPLKMLRWRYPSIWSTDAIGINEAKSHTCKIYPAWKLGGISGERRKSYPTLLSLLNSVLSFYYGTRPLLCFSSPFIPWKKKFILLFTLYLNATFRLSMAQGCFRHFIIPCRLEEVRSGIASLWIYISQMQTPSTLAHTRSHH
jgi:hypothetical protein